LLDDALMQITGMQVKAGIPNLDAKGDVDRADVRVSQDLVINDKVRQAMTTWIVQADQHTAPSTPGTHKTLPLMRDAAQTLDRAQDLPWTIDHMYSATLRSPKKLCAQRGTKGSAMLASA
jgi:hypothetical protein